MSIVLGVPVLENHELTQQFVQSIVDTIGNPFIFELVIIDNASTEPYTVEEFKTQFKLIVKRYEVNQGFYLPLRDLYAEYGNGHLIGLCHNDIFFYEKNWDLRLRFVFDQDPQMALVGLCGSPIADYLGGRGIGTRSNFRGEKGAGTGPKISDLLPCVLLDSLFMMFRAEFIPELGINDDITPCHFYDKIWSMRMIQRQHHVGMLGIEIDHMGGTTSCGPRYQEDAKRWCKEHNVSLEKQEDGTESGDLTLYHEGERRYLTEFRDALKMIPCRVDASYKLWRI